MQQRKKSPMPDVRSSADVPGVSIVVSVQQILDSKSSIKQLANTVSGHLAQKTPVTLTVSGTGDGDVAVKTLEMFCRQLRDAGIRPDTLLGLCLRSSSTPLRAYAFITRCWLGDGPRFVIPEKSQMLHPLGKNSNAQFWEYLWRHRGTRWAVLPAYSDDVTTQCPLLADEHASAVLPGAGIRAPADTAWLARLIHLPQFADSAGVVDLQALNKSLLACIDSGDRQIDLQRWPTRGMQHDARANRRMAIQITGIGDLVKLRKADPSDLAVLQSLSQLMKQVQTTVWNRSAELARGTKLLPAIARHEPALAVSDGQHTMHWAARWHAAVERCAVRHRNLLVMSPYAVLPGDDDCAAYSDLLPLIGCADAHSFAAPPTLRSWKFKDYCRFHLRASAVMQRRNAVSLVATKA